MIDFDDMERFSQGMIERGIGHTAGASCYEAIELITRLRQAEKDAARYRWLRECRWDKSNLCVVTKPKVSVKLGADFPSSERLDSAIDEAMQCK